MGKSIWKKRVAVVLAFVIALAGCITALSTSVYAATWQVFPQGTPIPSSAQKLSLTKNNIDVLTMDNSKAKSFDSVGATGSPAKEICVKVDGESSNASFSNVATVKFINAGKIGGRSFDVTLVIKNLHISPLSGSSHHMASDGYVNVVNITDNVCSVSTSSEYGDGSSTMHGYNAKKTMDIEVKCTWNGTATSVDQPFYIGVSDIDAGNPSTYYEESFYAKSGFDKIYRWSTSQYTIDGNGARSGTAGNTDGEDCWYKGGLVATTNNGSFTTSWEAGLCASNIAIYSQYQTTPTPTKSVSPSTAKAGDTIVWTVNQKVETLYKEVYSKYSSMVISDTIPAGITYKSAKVTNGSGADITSQGSLNYSSGTRVLSYTFSAAQLASDAFYNGQTIKMEITTTAENPDVARKVITNKATGNISGLTHDTNTSQVTVLRPVITLTKSADKATYQVGDTVNYSVTVTQTNSGITGTNVVVTDPVPAGLQLTDTPTISGGTGKVVVDGNKWTATFATLPYNTPATIHFKAVAKMASAGKTVRNTATATVTNGTSVTASKDVSVIHPVLTIEKNAKKTKYNVGDSVEYTVKVNQTTAGAVAKNVVVRDALQVTDGMVIKDIAVKSHTGADITGTSSVQKTDRGYSVTLSTLNYNEPVTITYHAEITDGENALAGKEVENIATATASNFYDESDRQKTVQTQKRITVLKPTLAMTKTAERDLYQVGETVNYTVTVKQTTPEAIGKNVVVTDTVPDGLVLTGKPTISGATGNVVVDGNKWTATFATLTDSETAEIHFKAVAKMAANKKTLKNTASATVTNGEPTSAEKDIKVIHPELTVEKQADRTKYNVKDTATYTVKVNQTTEDAVARNIVIKDALQVEGITILDIKVQDHAGKDITKSVSIAQEDHSYSVNLESMNYNEPVTITYHAQIHDKANKLVGHDAKNIVSVTASNFYDEHDDQKTIQDDVTVKILKPGIKVTKVADKDTYNVGDTMTYTITVKETVEDARANDVVIRDRIPDGLTVTAEDIKVTGPNGEHPATADLADGMLTVSMDSLSWGETVTITVQGKVSSNDLTGKTVENTAVATWSNNGGDPEEKDKAENLVLKPALELTKEADKEFYNVGDTITYTLTVNQTVMGARANDVIVRDSVPEGLTLDPDSIHVEGLAEDNPAKVHVDGNDFTVSMDRLTYEETLVITLKAKVTEPSLTGKTVINAATAEWTNNGGEPEAGGMVESPVLKPLVEATKSADKEFYNVGDIITYTITVNQTVENARANDVVITDSIPEGLELDKDSLEVTGMSEGNDPTVNVEDALITVGFSKLDYGEQVSIVFKAKVVDAELVGQTVTNLATVVWSNHGGEPKQKPRVESPVLKPVVALSKKADKAFYNYGDTITWTVTATQTVENARANDVVVKDTLPKGITLDPDSISVEGADEYDFDIKESTVTVSISSLDYGQTATITMQGEVSDVSLAGKSVENLAVASWSNNGGEPDAEARVQSPVLMPVLEANKIIVNEQENYAIGETINYQITVAQTEKDAVAKDVIISDKADNRLSLDMDTVKIDGPDGCEMKAGDNAFTVYVPELAYGDLVTITCSATAEVAGEEADNTVTAVCAQDPDGVEATASALIVQLAGVQTGDNMIIWGICLIGLLSILAIGLIVRRLRRN